MAEPTKLQIHVTKELLMSIDELYAKEGKQASFASFFRRTVLQALEAQLQAYSSWEKRGRTWTLPNGESVEVDIDGYPEQFASFSDSEFKKSESEVIEVDFPRFAYEGALRCAALQNAVIAVSMKMNPELTKNWKLYVTTGDWFKDIVFMPTFLQIVNDIEKQERKKLLESFEQDAGREMKRLEKLEATIKSQ